MRGRDTRGSPSVGTEPQPSLGESMSSCPEGRVRDSAHPIQRTGSGNGTMERLIGHRRPKGAGYGRACFLSLPRHRLGWLKPICAPYEENAAVAAALPRRLGGVGSCDGIECSALMGRQFSKLVLRGAAPSFLVGTLWSTLKRPTAIGANRVSSRHTESSAVNTGTFVEPLTVPDTTLFFECEWTIRQTKHVNLFVFHFGLRECA